MKVVAFNGSPKKEGNTYFAIRTVLDELEKEGIEVSIIHVGNKNISGCLDCGYCSSNKNEKCAISTDEVNDWIQMMKEADGIIFGSPVYSSGIAGNMKSFLDRATVITWINGLLRHKVGASVVALRRSGGVATFNQLNHFISFSEMIMPTSNYWNIIHGNNPGDAKEDKEGIQIMRVLGQNMAYVLKCMEYSKRNISAPKREEKISTSFIR